jgi:putative peptidoglycan lipid II flippase
VNGPLRLALGRGDANVRTVLRNFVPAFVGRGVVQLSAFVDSILASFLPTGAVAALANAQTLYMLPVSLFGMSVAAAELPELSAAAAAEDSHGLLRERLERGMAQVAFFIVPSAVALAALGHVIAAAVFQTGLFSADDARYVWAILAGSAVGLLASSQGRLYSSAWYALHDTRTPLKYAALRVGLTTVLGYLAALELPGLLNLEPRWGAAGLTASAGLAGWVEFLLLRRGLDRRIGSTRLSAGYAARLWAPALLAAAVGWGVLLVLRDRVGPIATALAVLLPFGIVYLAGTLALRVPLARRLLGRAPLPPSASA